MKMNEHEQRDYSDARMDLARAKRCLDRVRKAISSRPLAIAFTKLEEAQMWLDKVEQ